MIHPLKVLFICRGSAFDGLGHVMRTRTVAMKMLEIATVRIAIVGDAYVENLLAGRGLDYLVVDDDPSLLPIYKDFRPDVVVFDLTRINDQVFYTLSSTTLTASLSPIFNHLSDVEVVFHRTRYWGDDWTIGENLPYIKSGLQYAVISDHCHPISDEVYSSNLKYEELSVAISMGVTDSANKTLQVLEKIKLLPVKLLIWTVLGEGYAHSYQTLVDSIRGSRHEIILVKSNDSMWRILSSCTIAILSGGTTTYEAAYAHLPSINIMETGRNYFLIKELVELGVAICPGVSFQDGLSKLNQQLEFYFLERDELFAMHKRAQNIIDGLGAARIARDILHLHQDTRGNPSSIRSISST